MQPLGAPGSTAWTGTLASQRCRAAHGEEELPYPPSSLGMAPGDSASQPVVLPSLAEPMTGTTCPPTRGPSPPQMPAWSTGGARSRGLDHSPAEQGS